MCDGFCTSFLPRPPRLMTDAVHRPVRSYVLRQGRVSKAQRRAHDALLPRYGVPFEPRPLDLAALFGRKAPVILEVGFGMGETTADIAAAHPENDYLAIEVHTPGVGSLLKQIDERGLTNICIAQHDAVEVIERMIAPAALDGVHVFFPDPWPKKRHHKRRLLQAPFVKLVASRLKPAGYIHVATDWEEYALEVLQLMTAEAQLQNSADGFATRPDNRPLTKFEARGLKLGHRVWDIVFVKRGV
jgi:tRNA (guanine-N7-)-methyltransferase